MKTLMKLAWLVANMSLILVAFLSLPTMAQSVKPPIVPESQTARKAIIVPPVRDPESLKKPPKGVDPEIVELPNGSEQQHWMGQDVSKGKRLHEDGCKSPGVTCK